MKDKSFLLVILMAIFMLLSTATSYAITISFDPLTQDVNLGQQAVVDVVISGLGDYDSPSLGVFDFDVLYDPTILSFSSYSLGDYLGDILLGEAMDLSWGEIGPGDVNLFELSLLSPDELNLLQPSSFTIATLYFDTLSLGTSYLEFSIDPLIGQGFGDEYGKPLDVSLQSGSVNVVPEPGTLLLVGSGLLGVGYLRRKRLR